MKVGVCTFQDGSYPCGDKDNPDCELCHKAFRAGIKEVVEFLSPYIEEHQHVNTLDIVGIPFKEWQSKLGEWGYRE